MTYPGNPAIEEEVRDRILETYQHALTVAAKGGVEEARLGCDFILRLDPDFTPAKTLAGRLQGVSGPVDVSDLQTATGGPAALTLEEPAVDSAALVDEFGQLLAARRFQELAARAQAESAAIATDANLQGILGQAQELMEAAPYVESFLQQARSALESGESVNAAGLIEKARTLDASHPDLAALQQLLAADSPSSDSDPLDETAPGIPMSEAFEPLETEPLEPLEDVGFDADLSLDDLDLPEADFGAPSADLAAPKADLELPGDAQLGAPTANPGEQDPMLGDGAPSLDDLDLDEASFGDVDSGSEVSFGGLDDDLGTDLSLGEAGGFSLEDDDTASSPSEVLPLHSDDLDPPPLLEAEPLGDDDELSFADLDAEVEPVPDLEADDFDELPELEPLEEVAASPSTGPSDPDPRIAELLDEGQAAFARSEFQAAIDAWSRIFLIDIDHKEAARRIDEARGQKAEEERQVEASFHEGTTALEGGDLETAEASFRRVVALQPNHARAAEYVEAFDAGEGEKLLASASVADPAPEAPGSSVMEPVDAGAPQMAPPAERDRSAPPPVAAPVAASGGRKFATIAAVVLLLVLAGGGFLWLKWGSLFPNTEVVTEVAPPEVTPIERATAQYDDGKRAAAIAQLKRLPPASPHYQEAQSLITAWEAEAAAEAGPSQEALAERTKLIAQAQSLNDDQRYWEAIPLLDRAALISPLVDSDVELRQSAAAMLEPFQDQISLLREGEYERSLRDLWLAREEDPSDPVANHLLISSYFNLGVRGLQQGRVERALDSFEEARRLAPSDPEIARHLDFSRSYDSREQDLLFRIYAKHLAPRPI